MMHSAVKVGLVGVLILLASACTSSSAFEGDDGAVQQISATEAKLCRPLAGVSVQSESSPDADMEWTAMQRARAAVASKGGNALVVKELTVTSSSMNTASHMTLKADAFACGNGKS